MKHLFKIFTLLIALFAISTTSAQPTSNKDDVHNVILMIGDGMGLAHTAALMIEQKYQPTAFDRAQYIGIVKTYSANDRVTDSAAGATAMATGHKTRNGCIGMTLDGKTIPNLTELAKAKGLATGLVVTSNLADATPAGFAAHALHRDDDKTITAAYSTIGIDILAGGGRAYFEKSLDGRNIIKELEAQGYHYAPTFTDFCKAEVTPLIGLFAEKDLPRANKRDENYLADLTEHTLSLLSRNPQGFFAMIEGSEIDGAAHSNNHPLLIAEMRDFNNAVNAAFDFADEHTGTLVIVVADHETGGLTMISNNKDYTAEENGIKYKFSTKDHSGTPIVLYAYGTGAENFTGVMENTDIFHRIKALLIDKGAN